MTRRVFYICNVFADGIRSERGICTDSPAATRKVSELCRAVRGASGDVCIISLGRGKSRRTWARHASLAGRMGGTPVIYLDFWDIPVLTHFVTMIALCIAVLRLSKTDSVLVYYNYNAHYVGALLVGWLFRRTCILDLEDGHRDDDHSLRNRLDAALLALHKSLCNAGAMLACSELATQVTSSRTYVCYGVAPLLKVERNWLEGRLQVLLGGSLLKETGAVLFLEALSQLRRLRPDALARLQFVVTGFGQCAARIEKAATDDFRDCLTFRGRVNNEEYSRILASSHVGLCLKLPSTRMGATTFPSKVVELASHGLLVLSTKVSDVPLLFDKTTALLLEEATGSELSAALEWIALNPACARRIADRGRARISSTLAEKKVGSDLLKFWVHHNDRLTATPVEEC